jgi:indole-3-glycerol phosphate synthase
MTVLAQICKDKMEYVQRMEHLIPDIVLMERIKDQSYPRGFIKSIQQKKDKKSPALICEIKKASPSRGIIRADFDPPRIAKDYVSAGANCISVLTDQPYFKGQDEDLEAVHDAVNIPLLRKDFMLTPYQIYESRAMGADCILIIMAAVDDDTAYHMYRLAEDLGMDALIEIHDQDELDRALKLSPKMIGVNARNLKTLEVDINTSLDLVQAIPAHIIRVAESGISSPEQLDMLFKAGFDAFLIGEAFMQSNDIPAEVKKLLGNHAES